MKSMNAESRFSNDKGSINVKVSVLSFKENDAHIIFCPALDLSGSGNTEAEAKESFAITVREYLNYTIHKKTLWLDLKKLGWTIQKNKMKPAIPPPMSELLEANDEFSRIFDNYSYKKFDTGVNLPVCA
ncbi:MAG: hypothetical protein JST10_13150 [Bacteroidetes bacterium]|nr:hypothetical protein [Bacteroidota bacterium]MBS1633508.1 hypothetical protein [Bacteroidota bacterium]